MIGSTLNNRYRIDAELGFGGMGTVYCGQDTLLDREVAVKVLNKTDLDTQGRAHLLREAQMIAKLNHPNIVTVFDMGEIEKQPYIVMEFVGGVRLSDQMPESIPEVVPIYRQVCEAIQHAHGHGIIHRDLKPENVIITLDGMVKLMDFGLARPVASRYTTESTIAGTVFYLAPEQVLGGEIDHRVDLYALGVLLYELTTGELPFMDDDPVAVISQHLHAPVVSPRAKNDAIPPALEQLILSLLRKDPNNRPQSVLEVIESLDNPNLLDAQAAVKGELTLLERMVRGRMVGREQEVKEAASIWQRVISDRVGSTLLVSGEPGIGKTRLMREVVAHVEASGGQAFVGCCYEEVSRPFTAFEQILRKVFQRNPVILSEMPEYILADALSLAPNLKPQFPEVQPNPRLDTEYEQQRTFENMVAFLEILSSHSPVLMVIEDIHWGDSGTLALLLHLARRIRRQALMLLGTYREAELEGARVIKQVLTDLNRERLVTRLKLKRLDRDGTRRMLDELFAEETTPEFLEGVYHEAEGNPFFTEEICKALVESGKLYFKDGRWGRPEMEELEIPQGVRLAIEARIGKLPAPCQEALLTASVLGREFEYETLAGVCSLEESTLIDSLELAEKNQVIEEAGSDNGVTYAFVHALISTTLRGGISTVRRRQLHAKAAITLERLNPEAYGRLAFHYGEAGNREKALAYYIKAGDLAANAFAYQEAESYLSAALELEPGNEARADILAKLALVIMRQARYVESIEVLKKAADFYGELGKIDKVASSYAEMGRLWWWLNDYANAIIVCKEGMGLTQGALESTELADLIHQAGRNHHFQGNKKEAKTLCDRALEMARRIGAKRVEADVLSTIAVLPGYELSERISALEEAISICQEEKFLTEEARAHNNLGIIYSDIGNFRKAIKQFRKYVEIMKSIRSKAGEIIAKTNCIYQLIAIGKITSAEEEFVDIEKLSNQLPVLSGKLRKASKGAQANLSFASGNMTEAVELYRAIFDQALEAKSPYDIQSRSDDLSLALIDQGKFDEAEDILSRAIVAADRIFDSPRYLQIILTQALSLKGDPFRARHVFEVAKDNFKDSTESWSYIHFLIAKAFLLTAEEKWEEVPSAFKVAMERLEKCEARFWQAWLRSYWAEAHLKRGWEGDIARGKALYSEALEMFEEMGSPGFVERIKGRLAEIEAEGG
jgi:tetratricopeptide (TPR) repeat protein